MRRRALAFAPLVLALAALAGCATTRPPASNDLSSTRPAEDDESLLAPADDLGTETSSMAVVPSSTSAIARLGPNEAVDLEMEAERAAEEAILDELESGETPKLRSVLAATGTVTYDIPVTEHELVDQWTSYFLGRGRHWYQVWLSRSTRYVPVFHEILEKHGMPKDLVFLAMIESGFSANAYSWAHAAGPWQFIPHTGKRYGLEIDFWLDERRDFVRATEAAARYLKKLHDQFGDWYLAWAAYNAGEGRVEMAIRKAGTRDFWKLAKTRWLKRETRHYVPKLLAAAIVSKQPERYGIGEIEYLAPFQFEVVTVTTAIDLATLAKACGGDAELETELKTMNPALRRYVTPPGRSYDLRVPKGRGEGCVAGVRAIPADQRLSYRYHRVQKGDTPEKIAKKYLTTPEAILAFNNLEASKLKLYGDLVVPIPASREAEIPSIKPPNDLLEPAAYAPPGAKVIVHRVREGDSLWKIARRYRTDVKKLRVWNGLYRNAPLRVGQSIKIYVGKGRAS